MAVNARSRTTLASTVKRAVRTPAVWILLTTILIITSLVLLQPAPPRVPAEEQSFPVQTETVRVQDLNPQLRLLGKVESPQVSTLTASINAEVLSVPAREGARVPEGALMVELDPQDAGLRLRQARAELASLEAQLQQEENRKAFDRETLAQQEALVSAARRTVDREKRLRESDLTSEARLDEARTRLASAELNLISQRLVIANQQARLDSLEAQLARAQALRDQASLDLERARIRAPFDALVTAVAVSPGERVRVGDALVTAYPAEALQVRGQIPQRWLGVVRRALTDDGELRAYSLVAGERYAFSLARISGQVNPGAGGVDALFHLREGTENDGLVLGQTLDVMLELPPADAVIALPVAALYGTRQVFKVVEGRLVSVHVDIAGDRFTPDGQQQLLVRSGALHPGDQVVTTQIPNAIEGLKVEIRQPPVDASDDAAQSSSDAAGMTNSNGKPTR